MPVEILQLICSYLNSKTLFAFALTSKRCHFMASVRIFRKIHFTVLSRKKLQLDVDRWSRILERASSFKHVRHLDIDGRMPRYQDDLGELFDGGGDPKPAKGDYDDDGELSRWTGNDDYVADDQPTQVTLEEDGAWRPLASFIRQLSALADLVYACSNQFSLCLLEVLHQDRSDCRLYIRIFNFHSLNQHDTDPH